MKDAGLEVHFGGFSPTARVKYHIVLPGRGLGAIRYLWQDQHAVITFASSSLSDKLYIVATA